jgi:pantoate--beta-alanine ligase
MKVVRSASELSAALAPSLGEKIGFVPTMGALHEGHGALLRRAAKENSVSVLSVFVNPTQFGPKEDFSCYPRTFEADCAIAEREGISFVFAPTVEDMYPADWRTSIEVEGVMAPLCGAYRPGHFRGVATVVYRLFSLVKPSVAYFGQKDLQQCLVIERMVKDLALPLRIEIVPTVREPDGLAMSSRNRYLTPPERALAPVIYRALQAAKRVRGGGEVSATVILAEALKVLSTVPEFKLQYAEIRALPNLEPVESIKGEAALAVAGYFGQTRLIDNILL